MNAMDFKNALSSFQKLMSDYAAQIDSVESSWKGLSFDNFKSQTTNFKSEATQVVEKNLNSMITACNDYDTYKKVKASLQTARYNLGIAQQNKDTSKVYYYSGEVSNNESKLNELKNQIEEELSSISAESLEATPSNVPSISTAGYDTSKTGKDNGDAKSYLDNIFNSLSRGSYENDCPRVVTDTLISEGIISNSDGDSLWVSGRDLASTVYSKYGNNSDYDVSYKAIQSGSSPAEQFMDFVNTNGNQNIILSFNNGWGSAGSIHGHTMMVSRVENGKVYFIDNANYNNYIGQNNGAYEYIYDMNDFLNLQYFGDVSDLKDMTIINKK